MKSLMMLWQALAGEAGQLCATDTSRDFKTVAARVEHEGESFITITLPSFGKDLEKGLDQGKVADDLFPGFARTGGLPRFLGGFLQLVFDRETGLLLDNPNIDAIRAIRQLTAVFGKVQLEPSKRRTAATIRGFVECEKEVRESDARLTPVDTERFSRMFALLWGNVVSEISNALYADETRRDFTDNRRRVHNWPHIIPKHGPGATADRLSGNRKFDLTEWPERLERVFPYGEFAVPSERHYRDRYRRVDLLRTRDERAGKLTAVPKTLKGPRLITIEPTAMQYMQQALLRWFVYSMEGDSLMSSFIGFSDQTPNRLMAKEGSLSGELATLDLSEASDRVSNQLVRAAFARWPNVAEAIDATRTRKVVVPNHGVLRLAKYASMGSALTFPVEMMVFSTIVLIGIEDALNKPVTQKVLWDLKGRVRVYGDDIVVPCTYVESVISALGHYGCKVNTAKSFWTGKFRESCGREYYDGHDVSVVKVRRVVEKTRDLPRSLKHASEIESMVSLRNNLYGFGWYRTAFWLDSLIEPLLRGHYPEIQVEEGGPEEGLFSRSPVLGRWSVLVPTGYECYHRELQAPLVRGYVVSAKLPPSKVSGLGALQKWFLKQGDEPFADVDHLERAGRPKSSRIKLGLYPPG